MENLIDGQISFGVFISWIIIVNALQNLKKQPCLQLKRSLGVEAYSVSIKLKVQLGLSLTYSRIGTESTVVITMWAYALLQGKIFSSEIFQILLKMPCVEFRPSLFQYKLGLYTRLAGRSLVTHNHRPRRIYLYCHWNI